MTDKKISIKDIVDLCEQYGAKPDQVATINMIFSELHLEFRLLGINISIRVKTLDEVEARLRLLAPLFAEAALRDSNG